MKRARLGTTTDNSAAWNSLGAGWSEVGDGAWRVSRIAAAGEGHDLLGYAHARSGDSSGRNREGNKIRWVRLATPGVTRREDLAVFSESFIEAQSNIGLWHFDGSRTIYAYDESPVVGVENFYALEMLAIDGVHGEVSEGSTMKIDAYGL